jgi:outer membrane protein assembly factor BamA
MDKNSVCVTMSNGRAFRSYYFSFTEPWLGGKKRNSLTVSVYSSKFSNAIDYLTGRIDKKTFDTELPEDVRSVSFTR